MCICTYVCTSNSSLAFAEVHDGKRRAACTQISRRMLEQQLTATQVNPVYLISSMKSSSYEHWYLCFNQSFQKTLSVSTHNKFFVKPAQIHSVAFL
jgi:hypothetical protein